MCGGQELASGLEIVNGWFTERGDSFLNIFCCELYKCSYKTNNFLGQVIEKSCDSVGCSHGRPLSLVIIKFYPPILFFTNYTITIPWECLCGMLGGLVSSSLA